MRPTLASTSASAHWNAPRLASLPASLRISAARPSMRPSSSPSVRMMSLELPSTLPARSFTASATTAKPRPASPARLASTLALNATSRVCSAIWPIWRAASATARSVSTMPATSSPTPCTALRARSTAARLSPLCAPIASCACTTCCSCCISAFSASDWRVDAASASPTKPRTSAASRPTFDACWASRPTTVRPSTASLAADDPAGAATASSLAADAMPEGRWRRSVSRRRMVFTAGPSVTAIRCRALGGG